MIEIFVKTEEGEILAQTSHSIEAFLCVDRVYRPGDYVEMISDHQHIWARLDAALLPGEVYLPNGRMTWVVPAGEHRLAYMPGAFEQRRHIIEARVMTDAEILARRNLALNPADLRGNTDFFPHCTANVETRNEACFCARNVIDGLRHNTFHGEWPFQSWGIGAREDAWCKVEFGREVEIDEMALTLRADFPHDAYWTQGHVVFSDGSELAFDLEKTGDRQFIPLGQRRVSWARLERMIKSDDPSAFPALTEWEIFGCDARN